MNSPNKDYEKLPVIICIKDCDVPLLEQNTERYQQIVSLLSSFGIDCSLNEFNEDGCFDVPGDVVADVIDALNKAAITVEVIK
jgi:hypothetical protein